VIEANTYRRPPILHPSPPECGLEPILLLPRWGSVSGPPAGRKADRSGRPEHDIELAVVCTDLAGHVAASPAPHWPASNFGKQHRRSPLSLRRRRAIVHRDCRRRCPVSVLAGRYEPSCPPMNASGREQERLPSTSEAANSRAKHHRANGYNYNSPQRRWSVSCAISGHMNVANIMNTTRTLCHLVAELAGNRNARGRRRTLKQSGPEKERSKTMSRIVQSYLFRLRLTSAQAFLV
jgi:hypothetical protein